MSTLREPHVAEDGKVFPVGTPISVVDKHEKQLARQRSIPKTVAVKQPETPTTPQVVTPQGQGDNQEVLAVLVVFLAQLISQISNSGEFSELRSAMEKFLPLATPLAAMTNATPVQVLSEFKARLPQVMGKLQG